MPTESETAYPRFKSTVTDRELREVYTPTPDERNRPVGAILTEKYYVPYNCG